MCHAVDLTNRSRTDLGDKQAARLQYGDDIRIGGAISMPVMRL
jgi:hypothetical protein